VWTGFLVFIKVCRKNFQGNNSGHFVDMIGIVTPERIFFTADSVFPPNVIEKYHLFFLYNIKAHLNTLKMLNNMEADIFVPGHGTAVESIENLEKELCTFYRLNMDPNQYVLISSTVRSYLSYMLKKNLLEYSFSDSQMLWKKKAINFSYKHLIRKDIDSRTLELKYQYEN